MLSLLAPYALFGLGLLAIPVIVHLFKPRRVRQTPFSSLRWLHLTQQRLARRIQWHQILLFLLRAAFIVLLVLAISRPMLSLSGAAAPHERFVVLDVSRSMGYQSGDRPTPLEAGKEIAAKIVAAGMPDDRTAVLLTGSTTQMLGPLSRDAQKYLPNLATVEPTLTDTDLSGALDVIRAMLSQRRPDAAIELTFITDNHQQSWTPGAIANFLRDFSNSVQVQVIDVSAPAPQNAWIAEGRIVSTPRGPQRVLNVQLGCIGDDEQARTVKLSGLAGMEDRIEEVTLSPDRTTQIKFELPDQLDVAGKVARLTLEPADSLPNDDELLVNLDQQGALRVLVVEGASSGDATSQPGFHLRTAVDSLVSTRGEPIRLTSKVIGDLAPRDFDEADVIFLADVPELSDPNLKALTDAVKAGRGLVMFLGPQVLPDFYNGKFVDPLHSEAGLLPATLKDVAQVSRDVGGLAPLARVQWNHPLLAGLFDPLVGDLTQLRFNSYFALKGQPPEADVLAWIDESAPAIMVRSLGAGRCVIFNTTANDAWSNLPRLKSFVPLVDRLLDYISGGSVRRTFRVGDAVALPLPQLETDETFAVVDPQGKVLTPTVQPSGGKSLLRLDAAAVPGIYRVERSGKQQPEATFLVAVGRGDSVLTPVDSSKLKSWWEGASFAYSKPTTATQAAADASNRYSLAPWLLMVGLLLLAAETFLANWLCPRVNPKMVSSMVHRKRLSTPSGIADR